MTHSHTGQSEYKRYCEARVLPLEEAKIHCNGVAQLRVRVGKKLLHA